MGKYYDMVKANYNKLRNDEGVMWGSIEMWDKHLEEMREHHPDKYWEMMRKTHEMMYGMHFDAVYAEWQVEHMHHMGEDGREPVAAGDDHPGGCRLPLPDRQHLLVLQQPSRVLALHVVDERLHGAEPLVERAVGAAALGQP